MPFFINNYFLFEKQFLAGSYSLKNTRHLTMRCEMKMQLELYTAYEILSVPQNLELTVNNNIII
jgi:hypothetical protein